MARHPDQPLIKDNEGVLRFKENKIVSYLAEGKLNDLARMPFEREAWVQLAQLMGYPLAYYAELNYVTDDDYLRAANQPAIDIETTSEDIAWLGDISSAGISKKVLDKYMPEHLSSQLKTYIVYVYTRQDGGTLSASARQVTIENVYTWGIEDGRLVFRDGNREIIAMFNQWLYFIKDELDNE